MTAKKRNKNAIVPVNVPICSVRHGSEVQNHPEYYTAVEVGDFAYLWTPVNHSYDAVKNLIISAHGEIGYEEIVNKKPRQRFTLPIDFTVKFYCQDTSKLSIPSFSDVYDKRNLLIPAETIYAYTTCYDYYLYKDIDSKYKKHNDRNEDYASLQQLIDFRENKIKEALKEAKKDLATYERKIKKRFHDYKASINDIELNTLKSGKYKLFNKYRALWEKGKRVEILSKNLNDPCSILTIRNRSCDRGEGVLLSRVLKELSEKKYAIKRVGCLFGRSNPIYDEEEPDSINYYNLYDDIDHYEKIEIEIEKEKERKKERQERIETERLERLGREREEAIANALPGLHKHGSEIQNYREKYDVVEVGKCAYLWTPPNHSLKSIRRLIINSHGGYIFKNPRPTFTVPKDFNLNFFCQDKHILTAPKITEILKRRLKYIPVETIEGGSLCYDYVLQKSNSSKYTQRHKQLNSYDSLNEFINSRESEAKQELIKAKKDLAEYEKKIRKTFNVYKEKVTLKWL